MWNRLCRLRFLLWNELYRLFGNPRSCGLLVVPPVMQMIILGYAATMDLKYVNFAVLDHSRSLVSRDLAACFSGSPIFIEKSPLRSEREMGERISTREIKLAVVIPPNFERAMEGYDTPTVQVIADGRNTNSAGLAMGYAQKIVDQFSRDHFPSGNTVRITSRAWYNPTYNAQYYMVPAMLVMIGLLDILFLTALAVAREREEGTFDQLLLTPYSSGEILLGKAMSSLVVGTCQLTVGLLVTLLWYRVPLHSTYPVLFTMLFSFLSAAIGLGILISIFCQNMNQSMMGTLVVAIPCAMLSGLATPVESMPEFFQIITTANPMRYGIASMQQIFLEGQTLSDQLGSLKILWSIAILSGGLSWFIFEQQRHV